MGEPIEEELHAAKAGDVDALSAVLRHVAASCGPMARYIRARHPAAVPFEETADLFQLALTRLLGQYGAHPDRLPGDVAGLQAHAYQTLRGIWVDLTRKYLRPDGAPRVEAVAGVGDRAREETSVSGRLARKEEAEALRSAMQALPVRDRAVVELHYLEGLALVEVAEVLGLHEKTIRRSHKKALDLLSVGLGRIGPES